MKGAFEFAIVMMFSMPVVVFGINFVEIMMHYNQARFLQNYIVTQVEHQNRLDQSVYELIDEGKKQCEACKVKITPFQERYRVEVSFPVEIPLIDYHATGKTSMMTQIIK